MFLSIVKATRVLQIVAVTSRSVFPCFQHFPVTRRILPHGLGLHLLGPKCWSWCWSSWVRFSSCLSWALSQLMLLSSKWSCLVYVHSCVRGAPGCMWSRGHQAVPWVFTVFRCSCLLWWSSWSSQWPEGRENADSNFYLETAWLLVRICYPAGHVLVDILD